MEGKRFEHTPSIYIFPGSFSLDDLDLDFLFPASRAKPSVFFFFHVQVIIHANPWFHHPFFCPASVSRFFFHVPLYKLSFPPTFILGSPLCLCVVVPQGTRWHEQAEAGQDTDQRRDGNSNVMIADIPPYQVKLGVNIFVLKSTREIIIVVLRVDSGLRAEGCHTTTGANQTVCNAFMIPIASIVR